MPARRCARLAGLVLGLILAVGAATPPAAQPLATSSILVVNRERLLSGSRRGQALLAAEEAALDRMRAEARAIEAAFEAEERELTAKRQTLAPDAFRALADEFDGRVVVARREQDNRSAALAQEFDAGRRRFYAAVAPVLVQLMERRGAQAILDENSVLLASQEIDITEAAIAAIDAAPVEDPGGALPAPPGDAPAEAPENAPGDAPRTAE
jgi:Skp family chaperone for outer membrane proteins